MLYNRHFACCHIFHNQKLRIVRILSHWCAIITRETRDEPLFTIGIYLDLRILVIIWDNVSTQRREIYHAVVIGYFITKLLHIVTWRELIIKGVCIYLACKFNSARLYKNRNRCLEHKTARDSFCQTCGELNESPV